MSKNSAVVKELNQVIKNALSQLKKIMGNDKEKKQDFLYWVNKLLSDVISTTVDLAKIHSPHSAPLLYAQIEAAARLGGLHATQNIKPADVPILADSVPSLESDEMLTAVNYLGQILFTNLFKGFNELPISLRHPETVLRSVEAFLTNLLKSRFHASHQILNDLCNHVHVGLDDF
jgi:hypothetical protein